MVCECDVTCQDQCCLSLGVMLDLCLPSKRVHSGGVVGGKVNADNDHKHKCAMSVEHKCVCAQRHLSTIAL